MGLCKIVVAVVMLCISAQAVAQPAWTTAAPNCECGPPSTQARAGLHVAVGLGLLVTMGGLHMDGDIGWHLNPRLVIGGTHQFYAHHPHEVDADFLTLTGVFAKVWATPSWWVKGAAGRSRGHWSNPFVADQYVMNGNALALAVGRELISRRWFSLDLRGEYFVAKFDEGESHRVALSVGFGFD